jgi:undecaprenyl-diphosphatase
VTLFIVISNYIKSAVFCIWISVIEWHMSARHFIRLEKGELPMLSRLDYGWFQIINQLAVSFKPLDPLMVFLSEKGEYLFYLGIVVYWFSRKSKNRSMVIEAMLSAAIALGINALIGLFFYRDRPFVHHDVIQLIKHVANASFPSDHATGAFVIATAIFRCRKRDGLIWILLAAGVAFSRVWTGVHYPMDVLAGTIIGVLTATVVHHWTPSWIGNTLVKCHSFYDKFEQRIWKPKRKHYRYH